MANASLPVAFPSGIVASTLCIFPAIASAAKILATTIFFLPVLFFAISDTTM